MCPEGHAGQTGLSVALSVPIPIKTNKQNQRRHKVIPLPPFFLFSLAFHLGTSGQAGALVWT